MPTTKTMMNPRARTFLAWTLALFLTTAAARGATNEEQALTAENCALTVPADWSGRDLKHVPGVVAAFGDAAGQRTLLVLVQGRGQPGEAASDSFVTGFDIGMEKSGGGQKTSGKFVQLAGFRTYERRGTATLQGQHVTTLVLAVPTGDGTYLLEALMTNGEAGDDPQIRQTVDSFHFLHPPGLPHTPPDSAYRIGYFGGLILFLLLILAGIWALVRAFSRRGPPPPPPGYPGTFAYPQAVFPPPPPLPPPIRPSSPPPPPYGP